MEEIKVSELSKMAKVLGTGRALEIAEAANKVVDWEEDRRQIEDELYKEMNNLEEAAMRTDYKEIRHTCLVVAEMIAHLILKFYKGEDE